MNDKLSIIFALHAIEQLFPENHEPQDLVTLDDEMLHKLTKPMTGRKLRTLLQAYIGLLEERQKQDSVGS